MNEIRLTYAETNPNKIRLMQIITAQTYSVFITAVIIDWLLGSGFGAILQRNGFTPDDQLALWFYQATLFSTCTTMLLFTLPLLRSPWFAFLANAALFLSFTEDILYYYLLRIWNPWNQIIPDKIEYISSWLGFLTQGRVKVPWEIALFLSIATVSTIAIITLTRKR